MPGRTMAVFNRRVTNHVIGLWAGLLPPWAMVTHVGRRSGRTYRTPVAAFVARDTVAISLAYGADVDWAQNLVGGGGGQLRRLGRTYELVEPRIITRDERDEMPKSLRRVAQASPHTLVAKLGAPGS